MDINPLRVSCAIIEDQGLVLATRRAATGSMPGKWEFPGGKIEEGESPEDCLHREIWEELDQGIRILFPLPPSPHRYPRFSILLHPFVCSLVSSERELTLRDHSQAVWKKPEELYQLDWTGADIPVLESYLARRRSPGIEEAL